MKMTRNGRVILVAVLAVVVIGAIWAYRGFLASPRYSLGMVREAVEQHDLTMFEKYVDVDGLLDRLMMDLRETVDSGSKSDLFGEAARDLLGGLVKDSFKKDIKQSIASYVERGTFDRSILDQREIKKAVGRLPLEGLRIGGVRGVEKSGKVSTVSLDIPVTDYEGSAVLDVMLRDKGRYWQVAELSDINGFLGQVEEVRRSYPYRRLLGTARRILQGRDSEDSYYVRAYLEKAKQSRELGRDRRAGTLEAEALRFARSMSNESERFNALGRFVHFQREEDEDWDAEPVQLEMDALVRSMRASNRDRDWMVARYASFLAGLGRLDSAVERAQSVRDRDIRNNALGGIASTLLSQDKTDDALRVARRIDASKRDWVFANIINHLLTEGDLERGVGLSAELRDLGSADTIPTTFAMVAKELARAGQLEQAESLLDAAREALNRRGRSGRSAQYATLATECARLARHEDAHSLIDQSIRAGRRERYTSKADTARGLASARALLGDLDAVYDSTRTLDEFERNRVIASAVTALAETGDLGGLDAIARETGAKFPLSSLTPLITGGRAKDVVTLVTTVAAVAGDEKVYVSRIATELAEEGAWEEAVAAARAVSNPWSAAMAFAELAVKSRVDGEKKRAEEIGAEALEQARKITDSGDKASALLAALWPLRDWIDSTTAQEALDEVYDLSKAVEDPGKEFHLLRSSAVGLAPYHDDQRSAEMLMEAVEVFSTFEDSERRRWWLWEVAVDGATLDLDPDGEEALARRIMEFVGN